MIERHLDISTSHLKQSTVRMLERLAGLDDATRSKEAGYAFPPMNIAEFFTGLFVTLPSPAALAEAGDGFPSDLRDALEFARDQQVVVIRFDQGSDEVDGLQVFNW